VRERSQAAPPPACGAACDLTLTGWSATSPLVTARWDHATFAAETPAGAFLYVLGGATDAPMLDVERAAIHPDGTLGAFSSVAALPTFISGAGVVQVGRAVVLAGGRDSISSAQTFVAVVADDGGVSVTPGPPLGTARDHLTLSYRDGFVYAVGGRHQVYNAQENTIVTFSDAVERAPFDGATLGAFEALAPLPLTLGSQGSFLAGDDLYLLGGTTDSPGAGPGERADVLHAPFAAGGTIGAFAVAGAFVAPRQGFATFAASGRAFAIAGEEGSDDVKVASLHGDGTLGAFSPLPALPAARGHAHQAPVYGSFVYLAGGVLDNVPRSDVFIGTLSAPQP